MGNNEYRCEIKDEERVYKIGTFSKMNYVTIKTLRHYDNIGLLKPSYIDEENGYRYYTSKQLPILHEILALRDIGFSLDEIKQVQRGVCEKDILQKKKSEILKKIGEETMKLSKIESYLSNDKINVEYPVIIKSLPEVIVASMRTKINSYDEIFTIVPPMGVEMERLGCVCAEPEYCYTIYHDKEHKENNIDVEVCEAVTELKENSEMVKFKVVPKVNMAACVYHKGSYDKFPQAYSALTKFIVENGYEIIDTPRESYIDGVWNKDNVEDWLTEIQFPIKKIEK